MPEHATLYCSKAGAPNVAELRELAPDAEVRAMRAGFLAQGGELVVAWPDHQLRVSAMPAGERAPHLAGFLGFLRAHGASAHTGRAEASAEVIGVTAEPGFDARSRQLVNALAARRAALI